MSSLVSWECDDKADFDGEVRWRSIQEPYDPCWGSIMVENLVVCRVDDEPSVWLDPLREDSSKDPLFRIKGTEGEVSIEFGVVFCIVPEPVAVDRWLGAWNQGSS